MSSSYLSNYVYSLTFKSLDISLLIMFLIFASIGILVVPASLSVPINETMRSIIYILSGQIHWDFLISIYFWHFYFNTIAHLRKLSHAADDSGAPQRVPRFSKEPELPISVRDARTSRSACRTPCR